MEHEKTVATGSQASWAGSGRMLQSTCQVSHPKVSKMAMAQLILYMTGWWLSPTPLKNDGVHQLG